MEQEQVSLTGYIKRTVHRANGEIEVEEGYNTIHTDLINKVNDNLRASSGYGTDDLFSANTGPPQDNEDGIAVDLGSGWHSMITTVSEPSAYSSKWSGTITGTAGTIASASDVELGHNFDGQAGFVTIFANPTTWGSLTLGSADTLTIDWTITVS